MIKIYPASTYVRIAGVAFVSWLIFVAAFTYFYDLTLDPPRYPYRDVHSEAIGVCIVALFGILCSGWTWFLASRTSRKLTFARALLLCGLGTLVSLYGFTFIGIQLAQTTRAFDIFFAEYNFLTFLFEVAPCVSILAAGLAFLFLQNKTRLQTFAS